jgi:peptide/nickel transport system permease protein
LITFVVVLAAVPAYLVALGLLYFLAFKLDVFPMGGTTTIGALDQSGFARTADILYHSFLPGLSLILASFGGWVLNMRGMMINVLGSDYLTLAKAKGLPERRIFLSYATRNAILPQITHLAIALGGVVAGSALVEIIFSYPGIGWRLGQAVSGADYTVIQGITFIMVLAIAVAGLVLDLIYPRLDPRITYSRR